MVPLVLSDAAARGHGGRAPGLFSTTFQIPRHSPGSEAAGSQGLEDALQLEAEPGLCFPDLSFYFSNFCPITQNSCWNNMRADVGLRAQQAEGGCSRLCARKMNTTGQCDRGMLFGHKREGQGRRDRAATRVRRDDSRPSEFAHRGAAPFPGSQP